MKNEQLNTLIASEKWKLHIFIGAVLVAGLGYLIPERIGRMLGIESVWIVFAAIGLTFSALAWIFHVTKCRSCGLRLVFYAMSNKEIGEWLNWLLTVEKCPKCGDTGSRIVDKN